MIALTKEKAINIGKSEVWKTWSDEEIVFFQLYQPKLCMPFGELHRATEAVLGRPVFNTEFGFNVDGLKSEFEAKHKKPTYQDHVNMVSMIVGANQ